MLGCLQNEVATRDFLEAWIFSWQVFRKFPRNCWAFILVGPEKSRKIPAKLNFPSPPKNQEALKGDILKGTSENGISLWSSHLKWAFALQFALDTSIITALSTGIPQGRRCLDREGAVWTQKAPSRQQCHFEMSWFEMSGFRVASCFSP